MDEAKSKPVKSADRVLDVIELVARRGKAMSHAEIAAALHIPKSSLTHLLRNLTRRGYLVFEPGRQAYAAGRALLDLARHAGRRIDLAALAKPVVDSLAAETGESASFSLYRHDFVERVCGADSPHALAYRMTVGARFPLYASSGGKAVLASLPDGERERYLAQVRIERHTESTLKSIAELRRQLAEAAREGVAFSRGEHTRGIVAVAAVVRRADGYPAGAVNVVVPSARFDAALESSCVRAVKVAAQRIEAELHSRVPYLHGG